MEKGFFSRVSASGILRVGDRLCLKCGTKIEFLNPETIYWIEASDQYIKFYTKRRCHISRTSLSLLEEKLDRWQFVRIHRRAIVNLQHVHEIVFKNRKTSYAILANGVSIRVSPFRKNQFLSAIGEVRILEEEE